MGLCFPCVLDAGNEEKMIEWKERKHEADDYVRTRGKYDLGGSLGVWAPEVLPLPNVGLP
jgi:hypothetical protein